MRILFISKVLAGSSLCQRLKKEGHEVLLFIEEEDQRHNLDGIAQKINCWEDKLDWVGKDGLIIFDDIGYGKTQDKLRMKGYSVVGGSYYGDLLEEDRMFGQRVFESCGMKILPCYDFDNFEDVVSFLKKNNGPWVIKQNGDAEKNLNFVGDLEDNKDILSLLRVYEENNKNSFKNVHLQKKVCGIEIGVGRYFNGTDWVGPIEINIEHKSLFPDGLGPKTDEMGTVMWYTEDEDSQIFKKTLYKIRDYLRKINFRGDFDINCIVTEKHIYPLEATARFGFPALQLQDRIHTSPWGEFLKAVSDGKSYELGFKSGFGLIVFVGIPPYPYIVKDKKYSHRGVEILFKKELESKELEKISFEEVSLNKKGNLLVSSDNGCVLHVGDVADTIENVRSRVYNLINKVILPKKFYRKDIGLKFDKEEFQKLKDWGWIN